MNQNIRNWVRILGAIMLVMGAGVSYADNIPSEEARRHVDYVRWDKFQNDSADDLAQKEIAEDKVQLFFYRLADQDSLQSSANVSVNDRFQVSLQPGRFSEVFACAGSNEIGADITGNKDNDLLKNARFYNTKAGSKYYFQIDVDNSGHTSVLPVDEASAVQMMQNLPRQSHQISRVVPECTTPPEVHLVVYFDTDKHYVKPEYYPEIQRVADYMKLMPHLKIELAGHTDSRASGAYNIALSQRRVQAVRAVLSQHFGIDPERIQPQAYGKSQPAASNDSNQGMQMNRRVISVRFY